MHNILRYFLIYLLNFCIEYKMIEGTELMSAYGPLISDDDEMHMPMSMPINILKETPPPRQQPSQQKPPPPPPQPPPQPHAPPPQQQPIFRPLMVQQPQPQPQQHQPIFYNQPKQVKPNYFDKLASKKKDMYKFMQSALIVIFALSVHFLISHYFSWYIDNHDISFEREILLRLLYPIGILFVGWNVLLVIKS
jgi:hypothetical protein